MGLQKDAETASTDAPKKSRGGAPPNNRNALKTGRRSTKTKPEALGFAAAKGVQKSAKLQVWRNHVKRVRREGRELLKAWGLAEDGASKMLGQELARARLILHRLDERNLHSLTAGGGQWIREQTESTRIVATVLARLLDRAKELMPEPKPEGDVLYRAELPDGSPVFLAPDEGEAPGPHPLDLAITQREPGTVAGAIPRPDEAYRDRDDAPPEAPEPKKGNGQSAPWPALDDWD